MSYKAKITTFILSCLAAGLALGFFIKNMNNGKQKESAGYIGVSEICIEDGVMTPETLLSFGKLGDPQISPDGKHILYGVAYTSIQDNKSNRNIYICDLDGSNKIQLTRAGKSVNAARWSADGKSIYFLQGGQLWKAAFKGTRLGRKVRMSNVPNGISDYAISPDESKVLYVSTIKNTAVQTPTDSDPALDKASAYTTENLMYRHWDHWVTEVPRTYVAPLAKGSVTPENSIDILCTEELFELPTEPFSGAEQLCWSPDSRYIAYSCRKKVGKEYAFSTNCGIYIFDTETNTTTDIYTVGGYDTDPVWSPDGKHLAWVSMPRDGYEADQQNLLVGDVNCGDGISVDNIRNLAADFDHDVAGPAWFGEEIYFNALMSEGIQSIFKADLDGNIERLTPSDWDYDFTTPFCIAEEDNGIALYATYNCLNFPTEMVKVSLAGNGAKSFAQISNENEHILSQLGDVRTESVLVETVDGKQMQCWVLYPPQFDENNTYPAIEVALGGPQGSHSQGWSYRWNYRLMAQQGYVVILPNRRGTTAFGQEWKEQISGDYSGLNMQDYLSAGRYIKSKPYVDKLACVGASYGGYSVYMLEGLHGDLFDCFIAHAGIFDEKQMWFTTEEMWFANWDGGGLTEYAYTPGQQGPAGDGITFGGMQQAGAPYAVTEKAQWHYAHAPSSMVTKWHTPILCIHGMMDYRIPYEQGMAAFNAAQMMGVPSRLVIFPEENHWIIQPQNALYWHREFYGWLERWMKQ